MRNLDKEIWGMGWVVWKDNPTPVSSQKAEKSVPVESEGFWRAGTMKCWSKTRVKSRNFCRSGKLGIRGALAGKQRWEIHKLRLIFVVGMKIFTFCFIHSFFCLYIHLFLQLFICVFVCSFHTMLCCLFMLDGCIWYFGVLFDGALHRIKISIIITMHCNNHNSDNFEIMWMIWSSFFDFLKINIIWLIIIWWSFERSSLQIPSWEPVAFPHKSLPPPII